MLWKYVLEHCAATWARVLSGVKLVCDCGVGVSICLCVTVCSVIVKSVVEMKMNDILRARWCFEWGE